MNERATYRIQLSGGFGFDAVADLAPYLAELGVSHLYASPYLQAASGSTHGYDVVDYSRVNEELGGEAGHVRMCQALSRHGLGQMIDVVPNHMAISEPRNVWWWDVLENGPSSRYARYFDVDWNPPERRLSDKVLLPILGDHYGRVLEAGELRLHRDHASFVFRYHEHGLPASPDSLAGLLAKTAARSRSDDLAFLAESLRRLPHPTATDALSARRRHRDKEVLRRQLDRLFAEQPRVRRAVDQTIEELNADPDALDGLLENQNYRVAYWRVASRELDYRRFFDVNNLAGLRMEDPAVFADTHRLILGWLRDGTADGLRIDHPDGLRDPQAYLSKLREAAASAWIVVEKILHEDERLPESWPVDGTTGYDFLQLCDRLFVDPAGEEPLTRLYEEFTGEPSDWEELVREKKHQVMREVLGADVSRLTELMMHVCERHRRYRDYTRHEVHETLREVIACFPVYRTYGRAGETLGEADRSRVEQAVALGRSRRPDLDPELFDFFRELLLSERRVREVTELVMRFQQLTGPVTAKGVEDTAFYCYGRLIALNEVGGDPGSFGVSPERFHREMSERCGRCPRSLLASSTHDTKRSESVRTRIALLSEIPQAWADAVRRFAGINERHRTRDTPDRNTEYQLYQTLVGAWPIGAERVHAYVEKAVREAKLHTNWTRPNETYESSLHAFIDGILSDDRFLAELEEFVGPLVWPGRVHELAATLLKLTAPGIPDLYQGTELWSPQLVDPDNRRPVDFELRRDLLRELRELSAEEIVARPDTGLPKLCVVHRTLAFRREQPELFAPEASYDALAVTGAKAAHAVAYLRGGAAAVVVPRLFLRLGGDWQDSTMELPGGRWRDVLSGEERDGGRQAVADILRRFPVALLAKDGSW